jgi:hypothetical protein
MRGDLTTLIRSIRGGIKGEGPLILDAPSELIVFQRSVKVGVLAIVSWCIGS